jgi:hypothetical protein
MALDLEKLKARLAQINGNKNDNQLLKFNKAGKVTVRVIDSGQAPDGDLFPYREFISLGMDRYVISDNPALRNDINKMQTQYFDLAGKKGTPDFDSDYFEVAKKLYPSTNWYAAVVVRGEEGKGVQIWKLNKGVYTELVEAFTNEDIGDFMDVKKGYDVEITVEKVNTGGSFFYAAHAECARKQSPMTTDLELMKKWREDAKEINIDDLHRKAIRSDEEIMAALDTFVSGGESAKNERTDERTITRDTSKELDDLVDEIAPAKSTKAKAATKADNGSKAAAKKHSDEEEDEAPAKVVSDLDSQFDEIMADD